MNTPQDPKAVRASIKNFRRLLELEPRHRGHREQLAHLFEADAQPKSAIREWLGLARDLRQDGFLDDALVAAREVLRIEPGHEEAMGLLASLYALAPRTQANRTVTAAVEAEAPGGTRSEPEKPLDAMALLKVFSAEEVGAELASQSSIDLSFALETSSGPQAPGDRDDGRATVDLMPPAAAENVTVELTDDDLGGEGEPETVVPNASAALNPRAGAVAVPFSSRAPEIDDTSGTIDIDVDVLAGEVDPADVPDAEPEVEFPESPVGPSATTLSKGRTSGLLRPPLPNVPLFSALPRASVDDLMGRADRRFFPATTELLCAGEAVDGLYVVLSGTVRLTVRSHDGRQAVEVGIIEAGGFFGQSELLEGRPSQVNARAVEDVEALKLGSDKVAFLRRHFPAFERTLDGAAELQTVCRFLGASSLFGALPARDRAALAGRFRPIALGPGEELFAEGASPDGLYLVTRGSLIIYREGATLTQVPAGDFVGVVALLRQEPARCTALAGPSAQVVCLDPDEVELVLSNWQSVREAFWREARSRTDAA